jgi:nucleoside 2-deoxyribosyltransferase
MPRAFQSLRIYLASSSRNTLIDDVLAAVRGAGHEAYDFRASGRGPAQIFPPREIWKPESYVEAIMGSVARAQFCADVRALNSCDCTVLLTPCGNDAHTEAGYAHGQNIPTIVYLGEEFRPGLMHRFFNGFVATIPDLLHALTQVTPRDAVKTGDLTPPALDAFPLPSSRWA